MTVIHLNDEQVKNIETNLARLIIRLKVTKDVDEINAINSYIDTVNAVLDGVQASTDTDRPYEETEYD